MNDITEFLKQNAAVMTMADLQEETGKGYAYIQNMLDRLGLKAAKVKEVARKYVLDMYQHKSKAAIAKTLGLGVDMVNKYYKELGIEEPDHFLKLRTSTELMRARDPKVKSVAQILGAVSADPSIHYYADPLEKVREECLLRHKKDMQLLDRKHAALKMIEARLAEPLQEDEDIKMPENLEQYIEEAERLFNRSK